MGLATIERALRRHSAYIPLELRQRMVAGGLATIHTSSAAWECIYQTRRCTEGMPAGMRRTLLLAAARQYARFSVPAMCRRQKRMREAETVLPLAEDLHLMLAGVGVDRLDCEAIALDALDAFKHPERRPMRG